MKKLYYIIQIDDHQTFNNIQFKDEKIEFQGINNSWTYDYLLEITSNEVNNHEIIMKVKNNKLPKQMIKIIEIFLKRKYFRNISWDG